MEATEIVIPIFLHPHLFWLFKTQNTLVRQQMEDDLKANYQGLLPPECDFSIGEHVIVNSGKRWCRAVIEDILDGQFKYEVWLMDHGYLYHTNVVYKANEKSNLLPPLVKQASLYNVVFFDETLSLENGCIIKFKNLNPTAGSTISASQFLKGYYLYFLEKKSFKGVVFGDILYKKKGLTSSLTKNLTDELLMVEDELLFANVEKSRISDRKFYLQALRQASKTQPDNTGQDLSQLMGQILTRSSRGLSMSCSESDFAEKKVQPLSRKEIMKKLYKRPDRKTDSCTELELEDCILKEDAKLENDCNVVSSSLSESDANPNSVQEFHKTTTQISTLKKNTLLSKLKRMNKKETINAKTDVESISDVDETSRFGVDSDKKPKLLKAPNTLFHPEGLRIISKSKKKPKMDNSSNGYYSDSVLSNTNRKNNTLSSKRENDDKNLNSIQEIETDVTANSESEWSKSSDNRRNILEQHTQMEINPTCRCAQCEHWTTSDDWRVKAENFSEECKPKYLEIIKSQSLTLKGIRNHKLKLNSINYNSMTKIEKQATPKLLVHGQLLPIPIVRVVEASFHSVIHRSLKHFGYSRTKKTQSYVWPAITRFMNVCCIHKKRSGKTMAYLVPLLSFLLEKNERYKEYRKGGPIITILCSNSDECDKVYDLCNRFLQNESRRIKIVSATYPIQYINLSSVDMIITIPPVLIELIKKNATNLKRLCHLVLDNVNMLFDKYNDEIKKIIIGVESMLENRVTGQTVQMILTGERWSRKIENFIKTFREIPLITIGDYLEAAIYGNMKLHLKCVKSESKKDTVSDILENKWKFLKSIILCTAEVEIEQVAAQLVFSSISFIAINNNSTKERILEQESNWEFQTAGNYNVLICTDQTLQTMLSITSAALLIHYSLPESWTSLMKRHNCLLENFRSPLIEDNNKVICESYILMDETCDAQIPKLYSFLKNFDLSLGEFELISKQIALEKEQKKIESGIPLCLSLKQFGYCHVDDCKERHILDCDRDSDPSLPINGSIKFKILKINDVNTFEVDIVEHRDLDGTVIPLKGAITTEELTSTLIETRKKADPIIIGNSYAYWDTDEFDDVFRVCYVKNIQSDGVDILIKETCKRIKISKSKLFNLPEGTHVSSYRGNVQLIVANLKPPFKDEKFSRRALHKLKIYASDLMVDNYFVGEICLSVSNTIWVNKITLEVDVFDLKLCKANLIREILQQKLAVPSEDHLKKLYALCKEAGISLPVFNLPVLQKKTTEIKQVSPQWAFLGMDNYNEVIFSSAISPEEIYVRLKKFDSLLKNLETDIAQELEKSAKRDFIIHTEKFYLAKDETDNKFCRVYIKQIENDSALCYWVDYGDETSVKLKDIRYLPDYLITKLPFQAIHCTLYGVKPIFDEWTDQAVDILYGFAFENDTDYFRTLYAKCLRYETGEFNGRSIFSILLKDGFDRQPIINHVLIDCGYADIVPNEAVEDFEIVPAKNESDDDNSGNNCLSIIEDILELTARVDGNQTKELVEKAGVLEGFFGNSDEEEEVFLNFLAAMSRNVPERQSTIRSITANDSLPAITAAPCEVNYCTPDVYWSQTRETLQLIIKLPNIETYRVKVQNSRIFVFQSFVNDRKYFLKILLHDAVDGNFDEKLGGLELKIVLKKVQEKEWPKLSKQKERLRNIHYMPSKEEMEEEKEKLILDFGDEFKDATLWGDEERPMFTVMSDLDSDFDMDLEDDSS